MAYQANQKEYIQRTPSSASTTLKLPLCEHRSPLAACSRKPVLLDLWPAEHDSDQQQQRDNHAEPPLPCVVARCGAAVKCLVIGFVVGVAHLDTLLIHDSALPCRQIASPMIGKVLPLATLRL